MLNALTIDVEDYYQVSNFERRIARTDWDSYPSRVVASTERILQILDRHSVQATFFILGYVADRHPQLVRSIDAAGHEIGSHSYWHRRVSSMSMEEFRRDLQRSRDALEQIVGRPITCYRAPSFSVTPDVFWALDVLVEEGFTVDSSLTPIRCTHLGYSGARGPLELRTPAGSLQEFPIATRNLAGLASIPICGGGYFRLFPLDLTCQLLSRHNRVHRVPFTFYIHPWEFDPEQPRLRAGSSQQRFRHYVNLSSTESKFEKLLERFTFGSMEQSIQHLFSHQANFPAATTTTC